MLAYPTPPVGKQLSKAASIHSISSETPFWFGNLIHLYVELRLNLQELEGAESVTKARQALDYIRKAADAARLVCDHFHGEVLEIHGRTLHLGLPYDYIDSVEGTMKGASGLLHVLLLKAYGSGGPDGWRMAGDHAPTLTVQSVGIHDDTSRVSLSPAANYPAKLLGKGAVPTGFLGSSVNGSHQIESLDALAERYASKTLLEASSPGRLSMAESLMEKRAKVVNFSSLSEIRQVNCQAAPIDSSGSGPTTEDPFSCFGMVLSMDLDGFTARVDEVARGTAADQMALAVQFFEIMNDAAAFAREHDESFVQFPFAGDNAIFAVTAENITEFEVLKKRKPVEVVMEWEKAMGEKARIAGFGGWGQALAAGGIPHGNSKGNLHVGGIILDGRRFLVGVGPGMRYARQAFAHVNPSSDEVAMSTLDTGGLLPRIAKEFSSCNSTKGGTSSYYRKAKLSGLATAMEELEREKKDAIAKLTIPSIQMGSKAVPHVPYLWRP